MYITRTEQADASNYCNLQGSNLSLKYISPYWKKGPRIRSEMRGSELTGSQEGAAIWKIRATTCCKWGDLTLLIHFTVLHSTRLGWKGAPGAGTLQSRCAQMFPWQWAE